MADGTDAPAGSGPIGSPASDACRGWRVIELGQGLAGSMPGMMLADNGADVVKVEPPWGDWSRAQSGWRMWNRGKRSIVLDLRERNDRVVAARLAEGADVLIESFRPGVADRHGLGWSALRDRNPRLVYCSISGFGPASSYGDLPGYDGVVAAVSGHMVGLDVLSGAVPGQDRDGPIYTAVPVASFAAAQLATQGVLAALLAREETGRGDHVTTSLVQGLAAILMRQEMARGGDPDASSAAAKRATPAMNAGIELCFMTALCQDGRYIQMCARQDHHFRAWLRALDLEDRLDDPRYVRAPMGVERVEDVAALESEIRARMKTRRRDEWMEMFVELDVGADPFLTPDEFLAHPQMVENGRVVTVDDPEVGPCRQVGPLALFAGAPPFSSRPAPRLGQHTGQVLAELDEPGKTALDRLWPDPALRPDHARRPGPAHRPAYPLAGVTILEVAYFLAGPLAATVLAEMGARVVKVEPPGGEPSRRLGLQAAKLFHGKESIVLDLKRSDGMAALMKLVGRADVFLHSFRPGVAERLGIDPESLLARNPSLVHVYAASYGSRGPQAGRAAFHSTPNALVGSGILQAGSGNAPVDDSYPDPGSALGVATAVMLGLHRRQRTGAGQVVETTMLATTGYAMSPHLVLYGGAPEWRLPDKGQHGVSALQRLYPCSAGWVYVGCRDEREWRAVTATLERTEWCTDDRFADAMRRDAHDEELALALAATLASRSAEVWARRARAHDAPLVAVSAQPKEGWMEQEKLLIEADHPVFGSYWRPPAKVGFEGFAARLGPACAAGEHSGSILAELGYDTEAIDGLAATGVTQAWRPPDAEFERRDLHQ
jgi:crotonobetainyl-CoA:carnitine CoA-transferase CaiB-like acyl-CoA transferase